MAGLDTNGDGLIDMRVAAVRQDMIALRARIEALAGAVAAKFGEIDAATALLGKGGNMSDSFVADYRKWRAGDGGNAGLDESVKEVSVNHRKIVDAGDTSVAKYAEAEQQIVDRFRS